MTTIVDPKAAVDVGVAVDVEVEVEVDVAVDVGVGVAVDRAARNVYAIIPIRHKSQRLPRKNYLQLGDKPLYHYMIDTLLTIKDIRGIIIDTNSPVIKEGCKKMGAKEGGEGARGEGGKGSGWDRVIVIDRDETISGYTVSTNTLLDNLLQNKKGLEVFKDDNNIYLQTHVTNPFLSADTIGSAINKYIEVLYKGTHDSLFTVNTWYTRLYDDKFRPINHDLDNLVQTQDLPKVYEDNSCIYLFTKQSFYGNNKNRMGKQPFFFDMSGSTAKLGETVDIDWKEDFELAESFLKLREKKENESKVALITGVSGGIGWATASLFKKEGWRVIGTDLVERKVTTEFCDTVIPNHTLFNQGLPSDRPISKKGNEKTETKKKSESSDDIDGTNGYKRYISDRRGCEDFPYDRFIEVDLTQEDATAILIKEVQRTEVRIDALINIAAMQDCTSFLESSPLVWDKIMSCNLKTPYFLSQKVVPLLTDDTVKPRKHPGCIVNVSSIHSLQTSDKISAYAISKAGISGMTRNLAIELAKFGIRVNGVCPGAIDTPMLRSGLNRGHLTKEAKETSEVGKVAGCEESYLEKEDRLVKQLGDKHLLKSVGMPVDIANAIYFLADYEKSKFITGLNMVVDGGASIRLGTE